MLTDRAAVSKVRHARLGHLPPSGLTGPSLLRTSIVFFVLGTAIPLVVLVTGNSWLQAMAWTMAATCMVGPILFSPELSSDGFHPYSFFAVNGFVNFALPALTVINTHDAGTPLEEYVKAMFLIGGAYFFFWLGYRGKVAKRAEGRRIAFVLGPSGVQGLVRTAVVLYCLGWIGRIGRAALGFSHRPTDLGGGFKILGPLNDLDVFSTLSYAVILVYVFQRIGRRARYGLIAGCIICLEVFAGALLGGRTSIAIPILYAGVAWSWGRRRPIPFAAVIGALIAVVLIFGPVLTAYRIAWYRLLGAGERPTPGLVVTAMFATDEAAAQEGGLAVLRESVLLGRGLIIESTLRVIHVVPTVQGHEWGIPLAEGISSLVIPRALWHDKPLYQPGQAFAQQFWGLDPRTSGGTSIPAGLPAQAYLNFGWGGLCIFPLLGRLLRLLTSRQASRNRDDPGAIVGLAFILFVVATMEHELGGYIVGLLRQGITYFVFLVLLYRRFPSLVQPRRLPSPKSTDSAVEAAATNAIAH